MKISSPLPKNKNRLEIIPLIDIMFFLLASFMLVSLSMSKQQTIKVNLPVSSSSVQDFEPDMINLAVDSNNLFYYGMDPVTLPELDRELQKRFAEKKDTRVFVSGDAKSEHGALVQLYDAARRAGFTNVAIQVKVKEVQSSNSTAQPSSPSADSQ